jgi:tetratricopeptide (TPR) repeat protein
LEGSKDPNIDTEIANALEKYEGVFTKSLQFLDAVLELDPEDKDTWKLKAVTLYFLQKYDEAIPALDKARVMLPEDISLCQILVECWRQKGDIDKVLQLTEECGLGK